MSTSFSFDDELSRIVAAAEKRGRQFLPLPDHMKGQSSVVLPLRDVDEAGGATRRSPSPPQQEAPKLASTNGAQENSHASSARQHAVSQCLARVSRLQPWLDRVAGAIQTADAAEERVEAVKCRVDTLADITSKVHRQSDALSANASVLMARKAQLERSLSAITAALKHFNRVDELMTEVSLPDLSPTTARFPALLADLEATAVFLSRVHRYKSAKTYSSRLSMAYQRAMVCLRDSIVSNLQTATADVLASSAYVRMFADAKNAPHVGVAAMNADKSRDPTDAATKSNAPPATLVEALRIVNEMYLERIAASEPQRRLLESRCDAAEAEVFVNDVLASYSEGRARIVSPLLAEYSSSRGGDATATAAAAAGPSSSTSQSLSAETSNIRQLLRNVADSLSEERDLFDRVWLSNDVPESAFGAITAEVADAAYQHFRAALLRTDELEDLAAVCRALQEYLGPDASPHRSARGAADAPASFRTAVPSPLTPLPTSFIKVSPVVQRMLQDAQERIVFRTSIFIRHKVNAFAYRGDQLWAQCVEAAAAAAAAASSSAAAGRTSSEGSRGGSAVDAAVAQAAEAKAKAHADPAGFEGGVATTATAAAGGSPTTSASGKLAAAASTSSLAETVTSPPPASPLSATVAADASRFVPLERCIWLLELLYPAVSAGVFAVFADESVHVAVDLLLRGAKLIKQTGMLTTTAPACPSAASSTAPIDVAAAAAVKGALPTIFSRLFLVRHLLQLREALTPFDVNLTVVEKGVNLSSLAARKLELFQRSRESKRDVEEELRAACDEVIDVMCGLVVSPMNRAAQNLPQGAAELSDAVQNAVATSAAIAGALQSDLMGFIAAAATRNVLWKPVRSAAHGAYHVLEAKAKAICEDFAPPIETTEALEAV